MIGTWSSLCYCHSIISCFIEIQSGLPFWCRLTQVSPDESVVIISRSSVCGSSQWQFIGTRCWLVSTLIHTHTHTHSFNGPFPGNTQVSRYQKGKTNLDFTEARDSEWQWHQLGRMQVCTSFQTDNHASTPPLSFLQAGCLSCRPTNSVKALKAGMSDICSLKFQSVALATNSCFLLAC